MSDILIGFGKPLAPEQATGLIAALKGLPGVDRVQAGRHRRRLIQVFFDPDRVGVGAFLETARKAGLDGRLIGA